ncbi:hypothetical protein [Serratia sp. CY85251]|uniref:hypothetical protein n=1 Tax=Serratia sp. CY85251 TaxID=3383696 RepID=UPI003F9EE4EE
MVTTPYALIFGPADVSHMMKDMQRLYATHPQVRARFGQVARSAGMDVDTILRKTPLPDDASCMQVVSLGLLAGMLGIADDIIEQRGAPSCVGGISLGELAALCISSGLTVDDAVKLIGLRIDKPESVEEAVGFVMVMEESERIFYHQPPQMQVAVDYGLVHEKSGFLFMVAGLRETLENYGQHGAGMLKVLPSSLCNAAYHTPYRYWIAQHVNDYLNECVLCQPIYPVVTCLKGGVIVTNADMVKKCCIRSETESLSVPEMIHQIKNFNVEEIICIGPFLRSINIGFGRVNVSFRDEEWVGKCY